MRVLLFDWVSGGHHEVYLRRFAEALRDRADVTVAAPAAGPLAQSIGGVAALDLGQPRPREDGAVDRRRVSRELAAAEQGLLEVSVRRCRPERVVHMYADQMARRLAHRPPRPPTTAFMFFPRLHYPLAFRSSLRASEAASAAVHDAALAAFALRRRGNVVMTLDERAASLWARAGVPAAWVPEPPLGVAPPPAEQRRGLLVFGALSRHKGINLIADAVAADPPREPIVLAGTVQPEFAAELEALVSRMRAAGVEVDLRARRHDEAEALALLAAARCTLLAYPRHVGMSRVLVESATAGTPVIAHDYGLVGDLVRRHRLGLAVDCRSSADLAAAMRAAGEGALGPAAYGPALAVFAGRYSAARFRGAVMAALRLPPDRRSFP